jgi:glycosyltransferase involved in cell wall biosynthesis
MRTKLLIVNNGLRDLRGHYFETGVSVAEAADAAGLETFLFVHAACDAEVLATAPNPIPLCRTDHWMTGPSDQPPEPRRGPQGIARSVKSFGRRLVPATLRPGARWAWRRLRRLVGAAPHAARSHSLQARLVEFGWPREFDAVRTFQEDLRRAIGLSGAGPGDHVFLPTAHGRELVAVRRLSDALGPASPTFHLEFRHALDADSGYDPIDPNNTHWVYRYTALHHVYFDWCRRRPPDPRVKVYTDTEELSEQYATFSGLPFGTLPIPFRTGRIAVRTRRPDEPLRLTCVGDVRDEKGFPWLPELVRALRAEAEAGRVRFAFQAGPTDAAANPGSAAALAELRALAAPYLELPGLDGPLDPAGYFRLVSTADVMLCPYDPAAYRRRSSGTLTEAIAAGVPTVVREGTWLACRQPPGSGETCHDPASFVAAVRAVVAHHPDYRAAAQAARERWVAAHNPDRLVQALVGRVARPGAGGVGSPARTPVLSSRPCLAPPVAGERGIA